ncbi:MAG: EamA family transporter [Aestuariivirga sp.]
MNDIFSAAHAPAKLTDRVPPHLYFVISAFFHYLGPAFAVLLFARVEPLGVAWLRIATAAIIFAIWRRPWRFFILLDGAERWIVVGLGVALALMNAAFYLALAHLPLGTVGAIEFLGPIGLAAYGMRSTRNIGALLLAICGVYILTNARFEGAAIGYFYAFANCALFLIYIVLGHRIAGKGAAGGIDQLGMAMLIALAVSLPIGFSDAAVALTVPELLGAGIIVGVCSSVIPYVCDQFAMARLPRASFALMLALLPATATVIGVVVLRQFPTPAELAGVALVVIGVAVHQAEK